MQTRVSCTLHSNLHIHECVSYLKLFYDKNGIEIQLKGRYQVQLLKHIKRIVFSDEQKAKVSFKGVRQKEICAIRDQL